MALSNVFREPRRELTESAVGTAAGAVILGGAGWLDYCFAEWAHDMPFNDHGDVIPIALGMLIGAACLLGVVVLLTIFLVITHALGESICNALERRGVQLRPRRIWELPPPWQVIDMNNYQQNNSVDSPNR